MALTTARKRRLVVVSVAESQCENALVTDKIFKQSIARVIATLTTFCPQGDSFAHRLSKAPSSFFLALVLLSASTADVGSRL